jgi:hypothetical protein
MLVHPSSVYRLPLSSQFCPPHRLGHGYSGTSAAGSSELSFRCRQLHCYHMLGVAFPAVPVAPGIQGALCPYGNHLCLLPPVTAAEKGTGAQEVGGHLYHWPAPGEGKSCTASVLLAASMSVSFPAFSVSVGFIERFVCPGPWLFSSLADHFPSLYPFSLSAE